MRETKIVQRARLVVFGLVIALLATVGISLFGTPATATAANPTTISFQGKVVNSNGTNVTDGTYSFLFKLYNTSSAGTALWSETQSTVTVVGGTFQVNLGASCSFFTAAACNNNTPIDFSTASNLYLGITFNGDAAGEMSPRVQMQSVPFAYQADNANKVGGLGVSQLVQLSPGSAQSGFINIDGAGTFGGLLKVTSGGADISGGLTVAGTTKFSNLNAVGVLHTSAAGVVSTSAVVLGTDTSGSYLSSLGSLTGLTTTGNTGSGALTPSLSVTYGSAANTAVQGNVTLICPSGTGNLSSTSGGNTITLGSGGACNALDTKAAVAFGTSVTTPVITSTSGLAISSTGANGITVDTGGAAAITIAGTNANNVTIGNTTSNPIVAFAGSGTFDTTTGAVSLRGNTTVTTGKTFRVVDGLTTLGGGLSVSNGINNNNGGISNAGNITGATGYTGSGTITTTGNINASGGTIQTNGVDRIANNGNLINIGTINASGALTAGGGANITGNVLISGATSGDALAVSNGTSGGNILTLWDGSTNVANVYNDGSAKFQNAVNSSSAFQIQNAAGWQVIGVDTTYAGLISNPGFEIDANGWFNRAGGTITRTVSQNYYGIASGQIVMTATTGAGSYFPVTLAPSTQYTLSVYVRGLTAATAGLVTIGFQNTNGTDGTCSASSFPAITTTGWTRLTCTFTSAASVPSSNVYVKQTTAVSRTVFIDGVRLEAGAVATPYSFANIALRGTITNPQNFRNSSDSTTAFGIANAAGASLLNVDTLNNIISIGSGVTGAKLALDITGTATNHGVCHVNSGAQENDQVVPCNNNIVGADYAELYPALNDVEASDVVALSDQFAPNRDGVTYSPLLKKTNEAYDQYQLGVVSEAPVEYGSDTVGGSQVIGYNVRPEDNPRPLALNGRVMTKVNDENGPIHRGDYITASSTPGVGMKATHSGEVVGRALADYTGAGQGKVLVFINPTHYQGPQDNVTGTGLTNNGGLRIDTGSNGDVTIDTTAAARLLIGGENAGAVDISGAGHTTNIRGDLAVSGKTGLSGGLSIAATDGAAVNIAAANLSGAALSIDNADTATAVDSAIKITNSGGAGFTNIINTPNFTVSGSGNLTASNISSRGSFQMIDANGANVISFDNSGNGKVLGDLSLGSASVTGGLTVGGDVSFAGLSTFQKLATFIGKTVFRQDVQFDRHITVAKDSAGYASLRTGETTVHIKFADEYGAAPIVNASATNGKFANVTVDHIDTKGFDIVLAAPAVTDLTLNWTAVGVNDPQTASNPLPTSP